MLTKSQYPSADILRSWCNFLLAVYLDKPLLLQLTDFVPSFFLCSNTKSIRDFIPCNRKHLCMNADRFIIFRLCDLGRAERWLDGLTA